MILSVLLLIPAQLPCDMQIKYSIRQLATPSHGSILADFAKIFHFPPKFSSTLAWLLVVELSWAISYSHPSLLPSLQLVFGTFKLYIRVIIHLDSKCQNITNKLQILMLINSPSSYTVSFVLSVHHLKYVKNKM